ncbi:hypothetical protein V6N13_113666 [Hibiscus sabdariffa]|uniref:Uncharacterized protein n=1 Tax=Hibiscus sabdariffa TaxID=183260 RepID=A0ABR2U025_9ROSI
MGLGDEISALQAKLEAGASKFETYKTHREREEGIVKVIAVEGDTAAHPPLALALALLNQQRSPKKKLTHSISVPFNLSFLPLLFLFLHAW